MVNDTYLAPVAPGHQYTPIDIELYISLFSCSGETQECFMKLGKGFSA